MSAAPLALVTGGARRLGAAISARLAAAGYVVAVHASGALPPDPAVAAMLVQGEHRLFTADFVHSDTAPALFDAVTAHYGRAPALLVNNASIFGNDRLGNATADELQRHYAVNLIAPVLLTQKIADQAIAGAAVVNIVDQRVAHPHADQASYTLAKVALAALAPMARTGLAGVRVNAVAPGLVLPTPDYQPVQMARLAEAMPLRALPTPGAIADAVLFLATQRAISGATLFVDGGAHLVPFDADFVHL